MGRTKMNKWSDEYDIELDNIVDIYSKRSNNKFLSDKNNKYIDETYIDYKSKNVTLRKWRVKIV